MFKLKAINPVMKGCTQPEGYFECCKNGHGSHFFFFFFLSLSTSVHDRTVRRVLNKYGYHYRQARRKGLLTENDLKLRMKFAKDIKKYYDDGLWSSGICFY